MHWKLATRGRNSVPLAIPLLTSNFKNRKCHNLDKSRWKKWVLGLKSPLMADFFWPWDCSVAVFSKLVPCVLCSSTRNSSWSPLSLESSFMNALDVYIPKLMTLTEIKGGAAGQNRIKDMLLEVIHLKKFWHAIYLPNFSCNFIGQCYRRENCKTRDLERLQLLNIKITVVNKWNQ